MATEMYVDDRYAAALLAVGLDGFDGVMSFGGGEAVSVHEDRDAIRIRAEVDGGDQVFYLKRTWRQSPVEMLRQLCRGRKPVPRPVWEYEICKRFERLGIGAMRPVGYGQRRRFSWRGQAFLIVEAVPADWSVERILRPRADGQSRLGLAQKRQLIRAVGRLVGRLHDAGFRWPDLVSKHILFDLPAENEPGSRWQLYLIDLERVEADGSEAKRERDLRNLLDSIQAGSLSRTDLLRFARAYCCRGQAMRSGGRSVIAERFSWARSLVLRK